MPENRGYDDSGTTAMAGDGSYRARVRLFVAGDLAPETSVELDSAQAHYLAHVMRLKPGAAVHLFNGRDGEWRGVIAGIGRGRCMMMAQERTRAQRAEPDLWLLFAPLKKARTDYLAEKATEIGASLLWPVFTRRTQAERVNLDRLRANTIEAAEQSERLTLPELRAPAKLADVMVAWPADRHLLFCDESGAGRPIAEAIIGQNDQHSGARKWAVMIGPEGGFARDELDALHKLPFVIPAGLGPRILRADTAALAALVAIQALVGDWKTAPRQ